MYSYDESVKRIEKHEVKISGVMAYLLKSWRKIVVFGLVFFLLIISFIGYAYLKNVDEAEQQISLEQLTMEEQERVLSTLDLYVELENMESFIQNSAYMKLDPFHASIYVMQYAVVAPDADVEQKLYEAYLSYVKYGGIRELMENELGEREDSLSELVTVPGVQPYETSSDDKKKNVLCIQVVSDSDQSNEAIVTAVKNSLKEYTGTLTEIYGNHTLEKMTENSYTGLDEALRLKQEELVASKEEKRAQIKELEDSLNENEKAVVALEKSNETVEVGGVTTGGILLRMMLAFAAALLLSIMIVFVCFFMSGRLKTEDEITALFDISLLGCMAAEKDKKNRLRKWDAFFHSCSDKLLRRSGSNDTVAMTAIKIQSICQKHGIGRVFISGGCSIKEFTVVSMITKMLKQKNIEIVLGDSINESVDALNQAIECGNLICVSRVHVTRYDEIVKIVQNCNDLNINMLGALVVVD